MSAQQHRMLAVGILLLAFALRVTGVDFGQPLQPLMQNGVTVLDEQTPLHPDEYFYVSIPLEMLAEGRTNPLFFENPTFLINLNYLTYALSGEHVPDPAVWDGLTRRSYAPFHLYVIGRVYSVLGGLLAVAGAICLGLTLAGRTASLAAGLMVALSFPLVQHSHYATTSSLATGFVTLSLTTAFLATRPGRKSVWRWLILAAVFGGLAIGNRYNAAPISFVILLAGLWQWRNGVSWRRVMVAWGVFPLMFLLTSPYVLLNVRRFWEQFTMIYGSYTAAPQVLERASVVVAYEYIALAGLGGIGMLLALAGMGLLYRRNRFWLLLIAVYMLPYTLVVLDNNRPLTSDQLTLLLIPLLAGLAALTIARLIQWRRWAGIMLLLGASVIPAAMSVQFSVHLTMPDTRLLVQEWVQTHLSDGSHIYRVGGYNVPLNPTQYDVSQQFNIEPIDTANLSSGYIIISDAAFLRQARQTGQPLNQLVQTYLDSIDGDAIYSVARPAWLLDSLLMNNAVYWHHPGLYVVCVSCNVFD